MRPETTKVCFGMWKNAIFSLIKDWSAVLIVHDKAVARNLPPFFCYFQPLSYLCTLAAPYMCTCVHTPACMHVCVCVCPAERVHGSPARPRCSVWCKLCMCKKHSIIRPSIIRGCQWALSGWYITLSCPLPQLGPTQPARHAGNTAGETYSTGRDLGWERCSVWCAFPMIMMPYCKCRPKNCDECELEGRLPCTLKVQFTLNFIRGFYSLYTVLNAYMWRNLNVSNRTNVIFKLVSV